MKWILLVFISVFTTLSYAASPSSDKLLFSIKREKVMENSDFVSIHYSIGKEAKERLSNKVNDLCGLENIQCDMSISNNPVNSNSLLVVIKIYKGVLTQNSIEKITSLLP